jgi:hypothetical protein
MTTVAELLTARCAHLAEFELPATASSVLVYSGLRATHREPGTDFAPDATTTIPLTTLWHAATVEEVSA